MKGTWYCCSYKYHNNKKNMKMNSKVTKIVGILSDKDRRYVFLANRGLMPGDTDKRYLWHKFKTRMGYYPDLDHPKTFNEKLQWLKLYNRKPEYTTMVDKFEVKKYVASVIGEKYVIPTLGVWEHFKDIDFDILPDQFVLKCTHDSGGLVIVRDKSKINYNAIRRKINKSLKVNYFKYNREWPYKGVKPRIIAEQYMEDANKTQNLSVYKIFCFNGIPYLIQTIQNDKTQDETIDYFDTSWKLLKLKQNFPNSRVPLKKPVTLDEMLKLAGILSQGHPFLRTDFYEVNGQVYFSEFTFFTDAGFEAFHPDIWDEKLGKMIEIPVLKES